MVEDIAIKTIHMQIQRLKPIYNKIKEQIIKDINNPSFGEFVVRERSREESNLNMVEELIAMYEGYMEATTKIVGSNMSYKPTKQKDKKDDFPEEDIEEEGIDEEEFISKSSGFDTSTLPKPKIGRRKKIDQQKDTSIGGKNEEAII